MKKIFLLLLTAFPVIASAQNPMLLLATRTDTFDVSGIVPGPSDSTQYLYNLDSTVNAAIRLINDPDSGWVNLSADYFSYDELKRDTSDILVFWDFENLQWNYQQKTVNVYDGNGNITSTTLYTWDSTYWKNASLSLLDYDVNSNVTQLALFSWGSTETWDSTGRFAYTYDVYNNRTTETFYAGYITLSPNSKATNSFDASNNKIRTENQTWNTNQSTWKNSNRDTFLYDTENNLLQSERENWHLGSYSQTDAKSTYSYNGSNQLEERIDYNGDGDTSFFPSSKYIYEYTGDENLDTLRIQIYDGIALNFKNYQRTVYYYQIDSLTGISELSAHSPETMRLYPVPCSSFLQVETTNSSAFQLMITDMKGQIIEVKKTAAPGSVDVSSLLPGSYYLVATDPKTQRQQLAPFIKE